MKRAIAVAALAVLALAPGCGDDEEALSREEFIRRANAICKEGGDRLDQAGERVFSDDAPPSGDQIKAFFEDTVDPEIERRLEELRDLKPPEELEDNYEEFLDDTDEAREKLRDQVEDDPEALIESEEDPFETADAKADALGLNECGSGEGDSGS